MFRMVEYEEIYDFLEHSINNVFKCRLDRELKNRETQLNHFATWTFTDGERNFEITLRELI